MPNNEPFLVLGLGEILWDIPAEARRMKCATGRGVA